MKSLYNEDVYSHLSKITHGHSAGEYVWIKGPMKMSFLDENNKKHKEDWKNNVLSTERIMTPDIHQYLEKIKNYRF